MPPENSYVDPPQVLAL